MSEQTNSVFRRKGRYVSGGVTEVSDNRLEWWERNVYTSDDNDVLYTIDQRTMGRLDIIAAMFLGESRLWWVLAQYNKILDPFAEIVPGARIYIPSAERVEAMMSGKTGGVPSTREVPISILPIV
jgi:hypothetical protein